MTYVKLTAGGERLIFPGLTPSDEPLPRRKFGKINSDYTKKEFEQYVDSVVSYGEQFREVAESDFVMLVHDLRKLSNAILHAAEEAKERLYSKQYHAIAERLENIIGSQYMLRLRTDVLDFSGDVDAMLTVEQVLFTRRSTRSTVAFARSLQINK
jgi:signal transduction histidine kinase